MPTKILWIEIGVKELKSWDGKIEIPQLKKGGLVKQTPKQSQSGRVFFCKESTDPDSESSMTYLLIIEIGQKTARSEDIQ